MLRSLCILHICRPESLRNKMESDSVLKLNVKNGHQSFIDGIHLTIPQFEITYV